MEQTNLETKNSTWNVAQGYVQLKILKPLIDMDSLVKVAIYGCESINETMNLMAMPSIKTSLRIEAITRLVDILKEVIENSLFACNKGDSKKQLEDIEGRILKVEKVLSVLSREEIDQRTGVRVLKINETHFTLCMNELRKIKKEIPEHLNKNNLIFPSSEEIDLDDIKKSIIEGG